MGFLCKAKSSYVDIRGLKFHYLEWGNENNPLIIMLHGFMDHAHSFDLLAEELMDKYHLIAWDARGFGKTEHIPQSGYYYFFDYLLDLELFIKNFTDEPVILLGHSMGGIIASLYSGVYPEKVKKMINLEGWFLTGYPFDEAPQRAKTWIEGVKNLKGFKPMKDIEEASERLLKNDHLMTKDFAVHLAEECTVKSGENLIWSHDPLHRTRSPQLTYYGQIEAFLEKIGCEVLLIEGDKTFFELEKYEKIKELYQHSEKIEIKDAGHNLHIHKSKEISEHIFRFLEKP